MTAPHPINPPVPPVIIPTPNPPSNQFFCDSDGNRFDGVISVYGVDLPAGWGTVYRVQQDQSLFVIRGGQWIRTDYDFVLTDTEAPFDVASSYVLRLVPDVRATHHNWFVNPNFENATPTLSYVTTANRTLSAFTRTSALPPYGDTMLLVSGYTGTPPVGAVPTDAQRLLTFTKPDAALTFLPDTKYRVDGQVNVIPRIFSWADARSDPPTADPIGTMTSPPARDWDDPMFDSGGHTWQEVLGYPAGDSLMTGTLYVAFCTSTGALVPGTSLVRAAVLQSTGTEDFVSFSAELTTPAAAMSDVYIGFFQGDGTIESTDPITGGPILIPDPGEFQRQWLFDGLMLDQVEPDIALLPYFDGSNPLPTPPYGVGYTRNQYDPNTFSWDSGDTSTTWTGAPDNSASVFTGASALGAYTAGCVLDSRGFTNGHTICEPVFISDPIIPSLSEWLGLLNIAPLSWAPRRELVSILGRHAPVALSQKRSTPSTEFRFLTNTLAEREQFLTIINSGRIVLLRNPDPLYPENMWYISIGDVSEERIFPDHRNPMRRWLVSAQVVDRPSGILTALTGQSWQNVRDTYSDWQAVDVGNDSWLNVLIGPATVPGPPLDSTSSAAFLELIAATTVPTGPVWTPVP